MLDRLWKIQILDMLSGVGYRRYNTCTVVFSHPLPRLSDRAHLPPDALAASAQAQQQLAKTIVLSEVSLRVAPAPVSCFRAQLTAEGCKRPSCS